MKLRRLDISHTNEMSPVRNKKNSWQAKPKDVLRHERKTIRNIKRNQLSGAR